MSARVSLLNSMLVSPSNLSLRRSLVSSNLRSPRPLDAPSELF